MLRRLADAILADLFRQFRWSYLPPLMVYFAAGISGLTGIVGTFFVKEYLGLSAAFLAGLAFWAGIPWALKMPLGHLVDLIWRWKALLIYVGAGLVTMSLMIMFALITRTDQMAAIMPISAWYVLSVILAPSGYVVQDSVADAMSVEAVPRHAPGGRELGETEVKALHTTMQTLGRIALISGLVAVALLNIVMFDGVEEMTRVQKSGIYARIYIMALVIPVISISGVLLASILKSRRRAALRQRDLDTEAIDAMIDRPAEPVEPNYWYFIGGGAFVVLTLLVGLSGISFSQEIVFVGSMAIVLALMRQLLAVLEPAKARALIGTAIIIFVFRAVPLPGAGATWFEIDVLGFDQQFLSVLSLITSILTLAGMIVLRPLIASKTITDIVILLTIAAGILSLPNLGLYYGLHHWTGPLTGGVVDARFIAVMDTAVESPLGQIAMIPMLAWIAKNAPYELKATFFAVMASFTNLALSASSLLTKYLNQIFVITREVRDRQTGEVVTAAEYSSLGWLLIIVAATSVLAPLITIAIVQATMFHTDE
ncbi:MAG: folate/biopterin family MFS transporter [Hyphomicrobiales bacterium]|nr:folate/biopterin family MFS transporter [Hyphomicrobiales bacterium]MCP4999521.1 folate/biopterin family MFS transporter [Hyphomicrobiales bacterium]